MHVLDFESCGLNDYARMDTMMYAQLHEQMRKTPIEEENSRMLEAVRWTIAACEAITRAGGSVRLLNQFPDELITTMIRNGLNLQRK